jgi:hypothetical protein
MAKSNRLAMTQRSSPVTSQVLNVSRHSLECGDFLLNAPLAVIVDLFFGGSAARRHLPDHGPAPQFADIAAKGN